MDQNNQAMSGFAASAPPPAPSCQGPTHESASVSINIGTSTHGHAAPPPPPPGPLPCPPTYDCQTTNHMLPPATSNINHYNVQYQTQPTYVQPVDHCTTDYSGTSDGGYVSGDYSSYNNSSSSSSASRNNNKTCCIITIIVVVILAIGGIVSVSLAVARGHRAAVNAINNNSSNKSNSSNSYSSSPSFKYTYNSEDKDVRSDWEQKCRKLTESWQCSDEMYLNEWSKDCADLLDSYEFFDFKREHIPKLPTSPYKLHDDCTRKILAMHHRI